MSLGSCVFDCDGGGVGSLGVFGLFFDGGGGSEARSVWTPMFELLYLFSYWRSQLCSFLFLFGGASSLAQQLGFNKWFIPVIVRSRNCRSFSLLLLNNWDLISGFVVTGRDFTSWFLACHLESWDFRVLFSYWRSQLASWKKRLSKSQRVVNKRGWCNELKIS